MITNYLKTVILFLGALISINTIAQNIKLSPLISGSSGEYFINISYDETMAIVATRNTEGNFEFYEVGLTPQGVWTAPKMMTELTALFPGKTLRGISLSQDSRKMYFSANLDDSRGGLDIYFIRKNGDSWSDPQNVGDPINTAGDDYDPSFSPDGRKLYFVRDATVESNYSGSNKCGKIMVAGLQPDNRWDEPYMLTTPINNVCERSPVIAADNKTLLFSSMREGGKGGFDIMYTKMIATGIWLVPAFVDTVNTAFDDLYPSFSAAAKDLYFTNVFKDKNKTSVALYKGPLLPGYRPEYSLMISGKVTQLGSGNPLAANILVQEPRTSRLISEFSADSRTGQYALILPKGEQYKIGVTRDNYSQIFMTYDLEKLNENRKEVVNMELYDKVNVFLNVYDEEIFAPLDAQISANERATGNSVDARVEELKSGRYWLRLPIGKIYDLTIMSENYAAYNMEFDIDAVVQFNEFERDVELAPHKREFVIDVSDEETAEGLDVEIIITNLDRNETIVTTKKDVKDGKYVIDLREGDRYEINVRSPKGYAFYNTQVDLKQETNQKLDVELKPLKAQTKLTLNDITFETNSAELNVSSFAELDRLVQLMKDNPGIRVEIAAYTDDVGSDFYNKRLSDKRAQSVVDYMVGKETPINRLVSKGYGEEDPIVPNDTDENRAKNRRVELRILEIID